MAKRTKNGNLAIGYIRVSTVEQAKQGVSLSAQEERLIAYCKMAGLELVDIVREESVSASIPLHKRPAGAGLIERLSGGIAHVVALKLDRLFRDAEDALRRTKEWDRAGIALHLVDMGGQSLNTGSAIGRMVLTVMSGFAELERNLIGERTAFALAHKKLHRQVFNHVPYGFERIEDMLVELSGEMLVVRLIQERRADGWSLGMIAAALNEDHVATKHNGRWHARTIKNILESSLYTNAREDSSDDLQSV